MSNCNYSILISKSEFELIDSNVFIYRDLNINIKKYKGKYLHLGQNNNLTLDYCDFENLKIKNDCSMNLHYLM